jgi:anti-sigma regulatory factor (Ser/Thr protein kinase)
VSDVLATERERFPADVQSARGARRFAARTLDSWGCADTEDAVLLLVSELVTNAVIHARSDVEVILRLRPSRVRVEVVDAATEYVQRRDAASEDQSGRGMALTEALAVAWGIDTLVAGKSVWFEVERGDAGEVA